VVVGWGTENPQRDAVGVHHRRTLDALLPPIYRAFARLLAPAGSLGDAPVDANIGQVEPDDPIIGGERDPFQSLHQTHLDPFVAATPKGGGRTSLLSDPPIGAAEDHNGNQLLEDHPVGNARAMAAERMVRLAFGQQGLKLLPDGLL